MFPRIPVWLIVLSCLLLASVVAERAKAASTAQDQMSIETRSPMVHQIATGNGVAIVVRFDRVVSHSASRVTIVSPDGDLRDIPVRLGAQPNSLYASVGHLPAGEYVLKWHARFVSGPPIEGSQPLRVAAT